MQSQISFQKRNPNEHIFELIFKEDEITWQSIIYDLIAKEEMNPWNVDISLLSQKFLEMLKKLKELDFRISGKMVLASALLLKIKSKRLVSEDIAAFDSLMESVDEYDLLDELGSLEESAYDEVSKALDEPLLYPRIPQPRKRKVSVYDLVNALEKALEVENRRKHFIRPAETIIRAPVKTKDMSLILDEVYGRIVAHFSRNSTKLTFLDIIPSESKHDKVLTFIPLLHLENSRRIDLLQEQHFGEIVIELAKKECI
ncbi:MAG: segregation/condensation protein A [Candidatus Woesearchaeota archaeon]